MLIFMFECVFIYVLVRILTKEVITDFIRKFFLKKNWFFLEYLFSCHFCMSFWISFFYVFWNLNKLSLSGYGVSFIFHITGYMFVSYIFFYFLDDSK